MQNVIHFGYCSFEFPDHWSKKERRMFTAMAAELNHVDYHYISETGERVYYAREDSAVNLKTLPVFQNLTNAKAYIERMEAKNAKEQA